MLVWSSLVFLSVLSPVLCCDWLRHYGHLSNVSLTLVQTMGDPLTHQDGPVSFPYRLYDRTQNAEVASQLRFVRDSVELLLGLYHHDNRSSSVAWDTAATERLLMTLHRQAVGLSGCVTTSRPVDARLRRYYRRLEKSTLYYTGGSVASWELIRWETKRHLERLDLMVDRIRTRTRTSTKTS